MRVARLTSAHGGARSARTIPTCPHAAALWSGVIPSLDRAMSFNAPRAMSRDTTGAALPSLLARSNGEIADGAGGAASVATVAFAGVGCAPPFGSAPAMRRRFMIEMHAQRCASASASAPPSLVPPPETCRPKPPLKRATAASSSRAQTSLWPLRCSTSRRRRTSSSFTRTTAFCSSAASHANPAPRCHIHVVTSSTCTPRPRPPLSSTSASASARRRRIVAGSLSGGSSDACFAASASASISITK